MKSEKRKKEEVHTKAQSTHVGIAAIIAITLAITACPKDTDPVCGCTVKIHPYGSPCDCAAAGTSACACTETDPPEISGMVWINPGTFTIGSPESEHYFGDNETQHQVTLSKGFYMGRTEVTQGQYESVMGGNPSDFSGNNRPVECVSWYDAIEFCNSLSVMEGLTPAYTIDKSRIDPNNTSDYDTVKWLITRNTSANGYRLPTEAEWEYACRAGTTTMYNTGTSITTSQANYYSRETADGGTTDVGSYAPNAWGLYDMHGNVWEWCWDWYGYYSDEAQTDPTGASSGSIRVLRGGSWSTSAVNIRSAIRSSDSPSGGGANVGFRIVRP